MDKVSNKKQRKIELVGKLEEKLAKARVVILADYRGLTHQQLEALKKSLKQVEAELVVTKNTLLKRALEQVQNTKGNPSASLRARAQNEIGSSLTGPTATLFAYGDVISPLKELAKTIKLLKLPLIKLGLWEGKSITGEEVLKLAALPDRDVLIAQVLGGMKVPLYRLHRALGWNMQKLVMTLSAIQQKKS